MTEVSTNQILGELLRFQRWAGGDAISADRIFGLLHGIESIVDKETESVTGVTREEQKQIEDYLEKYEYGYDDDRSKAPAVQGHTIKMELQSNELDETQAMLIMQLCLLQGQFKFAIKRLSEDGSSPFHSLLHPQEANESQWLGDLHYIELVFDNPETDVEGDGAKTSMAFSPCVPRVGEIIEPDQGQSMVVEEVRYHIREMKDTNGKKNLTLFPYVILTPAGDEDEQDMEY